MRTPERNGKQPEEVAASDNSELKTQAAFQAGTYAPKEKGLKYNGKTNVRGLYFTRVTIDRMTDKICFDELHGERIIN